MVIWRFDKKNLFDIVGITPRGTLGLCSIQIPQLMTHLAVYTLPFPLQLCYKPLGILQRVNKSQKVHISSNNRLQNLITSLWLTQLQGFPRVGTESRIFVLLSLNTNFFQVIAFLFSDCSPFTT